jgi:hypothetical protein
MKTDCGCSKVVWSSRQPVEGIVRARLRGEGNVGISIVRLACRLRDLGRASNSIALQMQGEQTIHRAHLQAGLPRCRPKTFSSLPAELLKLITNDMIWHCQRTICRERYAEQSMPEMGPK